MPLLALPFPAIDPVLIAIGPFAIRWYALAYIAGIVLGWRLVRRLVQRPGWALTPGRSTTSSLRHTGRNPGRAHRLRAVLSARPLSQPLDMLAVWRGGMSFHGGLIGVLVATFLFARRRGFAFFELTDALAVAADRIVPRADRQLHQRRAVGGHRPAWGVVFTAGPEPRHPSQLYEAGWRACSCSW